GRGEPVVQPAALRPEPLLDGVDERGEIVVGPALQLGDALRRRRHGGGADGGRVRGRDGAQLGPGVERRQLDLEPARELALVRPDPAHLRTGVAGDHSGQCRGGPGDQSQSATMRAASTAALRALSTPTVATGTPGGIWTIESRASSPSSTDFDDRSGTPITGSSGRAATTPGSAAARPAPQISTSRPRPAAPFAYSATASGARCAERT